MKRQIFYGEPQSGKTRKAMDIAKTYNENEVVVINGKFPITRTSFSKCTEKTKLIIIDDLLHNFCYDYFLHEEITVYRNWKKIFKIKPEMLIFTTLYKPNFTTTSFTARFELIEFTKNT